MDTTMATIASVPGISDTDPVTMRFTENIANCAPAKKSTNETTMVAAQIGRFSE